METANETRRQRYILNPIVYLLMSKLTGTILETFVVLFLNNLFRLLFVLVRNDTLFFVQPVRSLFDHFDIMNECS